ncbi:MAG: hypothetical protein ACRC18_06965 [Cetobacterium sp.]
MWDTNKDYKITWKDDAIKKTLNIVVSGDKVRMILREINFLQTTEVLNVEEVKI